MDWKWNSQSNLFELFEIGLTQRHLPRILEVMLQIFIETFSMSQISIKKSATNFFDWTLIKCVKDDKSLRVLVFFWQCVSITRWVSQWQCGPKSCQQCYNYQVILLLSHKSKTIGTIRTCSSMMKDIFMNLPFVVFPFSA